MKLNLGSGQRPFAPPWINIDSQSVEGRVPDVVADIRKLPYEDSSVEMCMLYHVAEHFGCGEAPFATAYRVLQPGGSLIVVVPDMKALAQCWLMGKMDDQLYFTNVYGAYMSSEDDRHKWGFTPASLASALATVGFIDVHPFDWRHLPGSDISRDWWMLAMEAVKK